MCSKRRTKEKEIQNSRWR